MGNEAHPDLVIDETGGSGEVAYLATLNATLFSNFPTPGQQGRISRIDVYGPPMISIGGTLTRYGIATIKVTAGVYEFVGTAQERRIATRVAKAVLNEAPYTGPGGPLQSGSGVNATGDFAAHWGKVTSVGNMSLHSNAGKWGAGMPWYNRSQFIQRDNDGDGSTLDTDADDRVNSSGVATPDGTNDFDYWLAHGNSIEDPWLRYWVESSFMNQTCAGSNCQPFAWTGAPSGNGVDHSNIFMNVDTSTFPDFNYQLWKNVAQSGAQNVFYYASDGAGTGTYKLNGSGASVSMPTATDGKTGVFFFDTATNTAPVDTNGDNSYDNLSDAVSISGGGYATTGFIFMNSDFRTTGNGSASNRTIYAPSEPYIDTNGNGQYDSTEYFLDLTYPNSINGGYAKNGLRRTAEWMRSRPADAQAARYQV